VENRAVLARMRCDSAISRSLALIWASVARRAVAAASTCRFASSTSRRLIVRWSDMVAAQSEQAARAFLP
jgi:hypothetical protein